MNEVVAIVGLGGTGSYILDFISTMTLVKEIRLFDDELFLDKNAARTPGPVSPQDIPRGSVKAKFHANRYSKVHPQIRACNKRIDKTNLALLTDCSTVFVCIDGGHEIIRKIVRACEARESVVIHVGMSISPAYESGALWGDVRVTSFYGNRYNHAGSIPHAAPDDEGLYPSERVQISELNALNAALAVVRWKKIRGLYYDLKDELTSYYVLEENLIENDPLKDEIPPPMQAEPT